MKKSNVPLYIVLLVVSFAFCGISLCFETNNKFFTICSSVGCSGIVSVVVAWLVERSNERILKVKNSEILSCLLQKFDVMVQMEMQRALAICSKYDDFELNKSYSISYVCGLVDKLSSDHVYFEGFYDTIMNGLKNVPVDTILQIDQSENGIRLHSLFTRLKQNMNVIKWIGDHNTQKDMLKLITIQSFHILEDINNTRSINDTYSIPDNSKNYIKSFRAAVNKRKAVE